MMKLALKNLYKFILNHRFIALIICVCQILSIFSLFAVYSKTYSNAKLNEYYDDEIKSYSVKINENDKSDDYSVIFNQVIEKFNSIDEITSVFNAPFKTYAYYIYPQKQLSALYFGSYFTNEDFYSGEKYVVVGNYNRTNEEIIKPETLIREVGVEYKISQENYKVIGCNLNQWDEISYYSLNAQQKKNIEKILFTFDDVPTQSEQNKILNVLSDCFPNSEIIMPDTSDDNINHFWERVASFSISILAVITLSYIMQYVLELRKKTNSIYMIIGIKKSQIIISLFFELIFSSSCIYLICSLVFKLFFSKLMLKLNIIIYEMEIMQYLYLYSVFLLCIVLILGVCVISSVNKTSKELYRRCS